MTTHSRQRALAVVLIAGLVLLLPAGAPCQTEKANPTAAAIAKEWRYPGVTQSQVFGVTPLKSHAFCLETYTAKADFVDVWNHFAAKSGFAERFKDKTIYAIMSELKG